MMIDRDISTADALHLLSRQEPDVAAADPHALDRRRFLKLIGAGVGAGMVAGPGSSLLDSLGGLSGDAAWAAGPVGQDDGILVVLGMFGGNDGLNTVVPISDGNYYDQHDALSLAPSSTIQLNSQTGLHPELTEVKRHWDSGNVAIVEGIGYSNPDLSHFNSMAYWMSGRTSGVPTSGWLGRWLDGHLNGSRDLFAAAEIGRSLPLHLLGEAARGTVVPASRPGFGSSRKERDQAVYRAVREMNWSSSNTWQGRVGQAFVDQLDVGSRLADVVPGEDQLPESPIAARMEVAARLINANLGFRVLTAGWGDFDSHAGQPSQHDDRMREMNEALSRFFAVLDSRFAGQVTVMTFSEFGRTSYDNDGLGTDHGTAAPHFVIGPKVKGGFYGQRPSLAGLRRWDRMPHHVDYRDYFGSVIDGWLGGGSSDVFGRSTENLGLFDGAPAGSGGGGGTSINRAAGSLVPVAPTRVVDTRKGIGSPTRPIGPGSTLKVKVAGVGPVPSSGVDSIIANVTLVRPTERTHLRVFAGGARRPDASTVNAVAGGAVPNMCAVPLGADGTIQVYNANGSAHCVVDVFGYTTTEGGTYLTPIAPGRVLDTRDGNGARRRRVRGGEQITLQVGGREGVPAAGISAVVLNVTTVNATERGHVVAWRNGAIRPRTSNLNYVPGRAVANLVIAPVDSSGRVNLYVSGGEVDLVADVVGCFGETGSQFVPLSGTRVLSTRDAIGSSRRTLGSGQELDVQIAGRANVPTNASAVMLNVTAVNATTRTHLRVFPSGTARPNASSLNLETDMAVANAVVAKLGANGKVRIYNANGNVNVIADVTGYFV